MQPQFPTIPGPITLIDQRFINIGRVKIEGFDVNVKAISPATSWGRFTFNLDGTYYRKYDVQNTDGTFSTVISNQLDAATSGLIPRYKQYAALGWTRGPWTRDARQPVPELVRRRRARRSATTDAASRQHAEPLGPVHVVHRASRTGS